MNNLLKTKFFFNNLVNISFLLMLIFPTRLQLYRGFILFLIGIYTIIKINHFKPKLDRDIFIFTLFCLFNICLSIGIAIANNNLGINRSLTVNLIWPVFFTWLIACNKDIKLLDNLQRIYKIGFIITSFIILFLLYSGLDMSFFISIRPILKFFDLRIDIKESYTAFNVIFMGIFIFGFGYFFSRVYSFGNSLILKKSEKIYNILFLILSFLIMINSGRTGFYFASICSILFTLIITPFFKISKFYLKNNHKLIIFFLLITSLIIIILNDQNIYLKLETFINRFTESFTLSNSDPSNIAGYKRFDDGKKLIEAWKNSPLFGNGIAFSINDANVFTPQFFSYESQYLQLLAVFGVFGFSIFGIYIFWIIKKSIVLSSINIYNSYRLMPLITGMFSMLVANSTNPYLGKFDFFWVIFLPLAYINLISLKKENNE